MEISSKIDQEPLVTLVVDREGLLTLMNATTAAIQQLNEWNFGDEYDTDITPYHDALTLLKETYNKYYET
jgi:hypothetical protein